MSIELEDRGQTVAVSYHGDGWIKTAIVVGSNLSDVDDKKEWYVNAHSLDQPPKE